MKAIFAKVWAVAVVIRVMIPLVSIEGSHSNGVHKSLLGQDNAALMELA
jgi:hypothetical protein